MSKSRFGHHPDPAIDFEIEVTEIESITESARLGLTGPKHEADRASLARRVESAMLFQVGGDPSCCAAKQKLRSLATIPATGHAATEKTLSDVLDEARISLRVTDACLECNADDVQRWHDTIAWLESLA